MTPRSQSGCRPGVGIQVTKASPHLVPAFSPSVDPGSPGDVAKIGQLEASQGCSLFSQGQGSGAAQFHHRPLHYDRRGGGQPEGAVTSRVKHPQETPEIGSWDFGRDMSETVPAPPGRTFMKLNLSCRWDLIHIPRLARPVVNSHHRIKS